MGKIVKTEKSEGDKFQFTLWENEDGGFVIELRKFFFSKKKGIDFKRFDRMRMTPPEFERFKIWIKNFKKK